MSAFLALLRLQMALLTVRVLPRIMLMVVILAAVLPILLSGAEEGGGFRVLADAADLVVTAVIILSTVMAAVSVSGDASSGALRAVLIRPISRGAFVIGQSLTLVTVTLVLYVTGMLTAYFLTDLTIGFSAVEHEGYVMLAEADMHEHSRSLLLLPLPAILCASMVGLLVSSIVDDVALAVVLSLALVMGPYLFGSVAEGLPEWLFTEQASLPIRILRDLSKGIQTDLRDLVQGEIAYDAVTVPLLYGTVLLGSTLLLFNVKDCRA